ncbi:MAG: HD domain-containing protein, partial [Armatimonadota bacterium]
AIMRRFVSQRNGDPIVPQLTAEHTAHLQSVICDRLGNWPPQWEGFHWPGYTYEHTLRVRSLALSLAAAEGADPEVVEPAALLHDIAKAEGREHAAIGAEQAVPILNALALPEGLVEQIRYAIATHSGDNTREHPAENRVLGDADLIDANFGYVATWRFITIRAGRESTIEDTVDQMLEWLPKKDELMSLLRSEAGLVVSQERSRAMHQWCADIREAFNGHASERAGLREVIEHVASDYHRASLRTQLDVLSGKVTEVDARAACARLIAEVNGEL